MPRFYLPQPRIEKGRLRIEGAEVKHIRRVLRLKAGDEIVVFDGASNEYEGTIVEEGSSSVLVMIRSILPSRKESPLEVILAQSLLKGEKMDFLIQKATELGIKGIMPFLSSRSVPLLEKSASLKRHRRWERIASEASKQCGRGVVPRVEPLQHYSDLLQRPLPDFLRLLLSEGKGERLKDVLESSKAKGKVFFIVGPEGGMSPPEVELAIKSGCVPVNLGQRILRSETASLCLLSILQYAWGDIG
jgi:16S rRNA (uracil1498-N3)-methyltransferase